MVSFYFDTKFILDIDKPRKKIYIYLKLISFISLFYQFYQLIKINLLTLDCVNHVSHEFFVCCVNSIFSLDVHSQKYPEYRLEFYFFRKKKLSYGIHEFSNISNSPHYWHCIKLILHIEIALSQKPHFIIQSSWFPYKNYIISIQRFNVRLFHQKYEWISIEL